MKEWKSPNLWIFSAVRVLQVKISALHQLRVLKNCASVHQNNSRISQIFSELRNGSENERRQTWLLHSYFHTDRHSGGCEQNTAPNVGLEGWLFCISWTTWHQDASRSVCHVPRSEKPWLHWLPWGQGSWIRFCVCHETQCLALPIRLNDEKRWDVFSLVRPQDIAFPPCIFT